jgi:hypothetical protein
VVPWDQKHCVTPRCSAVAFDRTGTERAYSSNCSGFGCNFESLGPNAFEGAYDWDQPHDTPLISMADGVVRFSGCRDWLTRVLSRRPLPPSKSPTANKKSMSSTKSAPGNMPSISSPHIHMDWNQPLAPIGTIVHRGDIIGYVGSTGASSGDHLDLSVFRLTNLTGGRSYSFVAEPTFYSACNTPNDCNTGGATTYSCFPPASNPYLNCATSGYGCNCVSAYGLNGNPGMIDMYGWAAPSGFDPQSWMFLGQPDGTLPAGISSDGALSINLMDPVTWPLWYWHIPLPPTSGPPNIK